MDFCVIGFYYNSEYYWGDYTVEIAFPCNASIKINYKISSGETTYLEKDYVVLAYTLTSEMAKKGFDYIYDIVSEKVALLKNVGYLKFFIGLFS